MPTSEKPLVWGAEAISREIGRCVRTTYDLLENGEIPGAMRVGGHWVFDPEAFRDAVRRSGSMSA
jgi:hypothetical protein